MSAETKNVVMACLLVFAAAAWLWPMLMGMYLEAEERKKRKEPPEYDERQRIARLRASSHALYVLVLFLIAWTVADQFGWFDWTDSLMDMTPCGLLAAWCVWSSESMLNDAFITWKDKRKDADAISLYYSGLVLWWTNMGSGPHISDSWLPFIFGCVTIFVQIGIIIYKARRRKRAESEELL